MSALIKPARQNQVFCTTVDRNGGWQSQLRLSSTISSKPNGLAGIQLDGNAATGDFLLSLSPANLTAARRWSFPDRSDTVAGLGAQTFTGVQTIPTRAIIGTTSDDTVAALQVSGQYRVYSDGATGVNRLTAFGVGAYMAIQTFSVRGSRTTPSVSLSGDPIGDLSMGGCFDATTPSNPSLAGRAGIRGFTTQNWSAGNLGCRLEFYTTASGSSSEVAQLLIAGNGDTSIVSSTASTSTTTGALVVTGGVGVGGRLNVGSTTIIGTDPGGAETVRIGGTLAVNSATLIKTYTTLTDGAAAAVGTLTNAPTAGNPTKWVLINDNGTIRKFPTWT